MTREVSIEVEGNTIEEAIKTALAELRLRRSQVKIEVLSEEEKGLFGMPGAKPAKIRVSLKTKPEIKKKLDNYKT